MKTTTLTLIALLTAAPMAASAQTMAERIDNRQVRQEQRIDQGVQSGALTARETVRLEKQQNKIERVETRALSDGSINRKEAARLTNMQNRASHSIARQKHDRQSR